MLITEKEKLASVLIKTASALDIPDHVYEDATLKYEEVGGWLGAQGSPLERYAPEIYPQGSFRLGTVVRPIAHYDYDIDLVCLLRLRKEETTQEKLKQMVGDRLKENDDLRKIVSPSCRCWLLDYPLEANMPGFHMDVLPAISNMERLPDGILLTDTTLVHWQKSNPKLYANWFYDRMRVILTEKRTALAKTLNASVEEVPDWQVKTPLQIAIQILKRHRDTHFQSTPDNRPASIIITTLAAKAYRNQSQVYDAFSDIVRDMLQHIENRNGRWWVANPVEQDENFADRWNQYPERRTDFIRWLGKAQADFSGLGQKQNLNEAVVALKPLMGAPIMAKAARDLGLQDYPSLVDSSIQVPALDSIAHCENPPWFIQQKYQARVDASVYFAKNGKKLWEYAGRATPKNVWLKFRLNTDVPPPYDVHWQVVNTGKEASAAGQLRGDFYEGNGPGSSTRWESTKFRGTHWVEGFVIKNGICVARSGRKTVKVR